MCVKTLLIKIIIMCFVLCGFHYLGLSQIIESEKLEQATIVGMKPAFRVNSLTSMQTISGKQLEHLNALSVADAVRYFSGVQLKDYGGVGGLKTINVRSMGSAHTAVFYDGFQIGNAQNGQVDLGKFFLNNIEEIQLFNGQESTILQSARPFFASNTLCLESKTPSFTNNKKYGLNANYKTGAFGLFNSSVQYQKKLSKKFAQSINGEYTQAHGRYKFRMSNGVYDTLAIRQNGDIRAFNAEYDLFGQIYNVNWTSKVYVYNSERGLPGASVANVNDFKQRQWDSNLFAQTSLKHKLGEYYSVILNMKVSRDFLRYLDPDIHNSDGQLDNKYTQYEYYVSLAQKCQLNNWCSVALSSDYFVNTLDATTFSFQPIRHTALGVLSTDLSFRQLNIQTNLLACNIMEKGKGKEINKQELFPVLSFSWQPFAASSFRVRSFFKKSYRLPTFNDRYYNRLIESNLQPEFTTQYDLGASWVLLKNGFLSSVCIQADTYLNKVSNKIIAIPSQNLSNWTIMNLGEVEIQGLEFGLRLDFCMIQKLKMNLGVNYTFQKAQDKSSREKYFGNQIPYTPVHSGSALVALDWKSWQFNYNFIYTGERYSMRANTQEYHLEPWYTSDISLNWKRRFKGIQYRVGGEINNLFNQYYDVIVNYPMPGRSFSLFLQINI